MKVVPLASGSSGNATLVQGGDDTVLIDAGVPALELEEMLGVQGVRPGGIDAVLITHRHKDHIRGATDFAQRNKCEVYGTRRTLRSVGSQVHRRTHTMVAGRPFAVGGLTVLPFSVPHDAPETVGFRITHGETVYGHATDLGSWDQVVVDGLTRCHLLLLEFNYDEDMLAVGPYPAHLKQRIAGNEGHLSNRQATALLERLLWPGLRHLFLAHLSETNNTPELAAHGIRHLTTTARTVCRARMSG